MKFGHGTVSILPQRVEAEAQQKAAEAAREAAAAAAAMTNGNGVDSSSDNDDVPKIVVDQEFVDEDRDPDEKTEELLKVRLLQPNFWSYS